MLLVTIKREVTVDESYENYIFQIIIYVHFLIQYDFKQMMNLKLENLFKDLLRAVNMKIL